MTEEHGDMNIVEIKFETKSDIVVACERNDTTAKKVFQLHKNAKSDQVLFIANVVERWEMLKHRFVGNDNYTDYFPAWYPDLADVVAGKSTIIRGLHTVFLWSL